MGEQEELDYKDKLSATEEKNAFKASYFKFACLLFELVKSIGRRVSKCCLSQAISYTKFR